MDASRAQSSVRWTSRLDFDGESETITTNAGADEGSQVIALAKGDTRGEVTVELVAGTAYVDGSSFALSGYMDFTPAAATGEAGRWLSVARSNTDFAAVVAGLTVGSTTSELEITGSITSIGDRVLLGQQVVGLRGKSKPQAGEQLRLTTVVYVKARGLPLPVEAEQTYEGDTAVLTLGHWDERVSVEPPSGAVPLQTSWLQ